MSDPVQDAIVIWTAGVAAVEPRQLVRNAIEQFTAEERESLAQARRIVVVGAGKAGAAMAAGAEEALHEHIGRVRGLVNVPEGSSADLRRIVLNAARPVSSNSPTEAGVRGSETILTQLRGCDRFDVAIGLFSGGGSALLPAPTVPLADKQSITRMLSASGATIDELNCVRKHLSRVKGGRLVEEFPGRKFWSLIVSDVINDPLDVIASGPTCVDPTTYTGSLDLRRFGLVDSAPESVIEFLTAGANGVHPETMKNQPPHVVNRVIGSNAVALAAASLDATDLLWNVNLLNVPISGEAMIAAKSMCTVLQNATRSCAILFGGETTVTLGPNPGKGGRNQEFVLAMLCELGEAGMAGVTILCAGTDGEDGPTDAAGAIGTLETLRRAKSLGLNPHDFLRRHDAYHFFEATGDLFKTGLTGTNVMDLGVILLV